MTEHQLTLSDLSIPISEIYEVMGYDKQTIPDTAIQEEVKELLQQISAIARPSFSFFITNGELDMEKETLLVSNRTFRLGRIITRQLKGAESYAFFVATAGTDFEQFQHRLHQEDDMVKTYIADAIGSIIAERTADRMERELERELRDEADGEAERERGKHTSGRRWKHTNRFSPGYCGWQVSEQQALFSLFPTPHPCGIHLTESSLMLPIKSVSGIIGVGSSVHRSEYTCGLCTYANCYRRKRDDRRPSAIPR